MQLKGRIDEADDYAHALGRDRSPTELKHRVPYALQATHESSELCWLGMSQRYSPMFPFCRRPIPPQSMRIVVGLVDVPFELCAYMAASMQDMCERRPPTRVCVRMHVCLQTGPLSTRNLSGPDLASASVRCLHFVCPRARLSQLGGRILGVLGNMATRGGVAEHRGANLRSPTLDSWPLSVQLAFSVFSLVL